MNLINCKKCGILFSRRLRDICDDCLGKEKQNIEKITKFIQEYKEHPFISMEAVSEATEISLEELEELYKNGRLAGVAGRIAIKCKICGAETRGTNKKGNFCLKCSEELMGSVDEKKFQDNSAVKKDAIFAKKNLNQKINRKFGFKKDFD